MMVVETLRYTEECRWVMVVLVVMLMVVEVMTVEVRGI